MKILHATDIVVSIEVGDLEKEPERSPAQREPAPDLEVETVIRREAFFVARSQDRPDGHRTVGVLHRLGLDVRRGPAGVILPRQGELPAIAPTIVRDEIERVRLVAAARHALAVDHVRRPGERVAGPPGPGAAAIPGERQLDAAGAGARRVDAHAIRLDLREDDHRVEQVLVTRAQAGHPLGIGAEPEAQAAAEGVIEVERLDLGVLRRVDIAHTVLDLDVLWPLGLIVVSPPQAEGAARPDGVDQVDARAHLALRREGLPVPAGAELNREPERPHAPAHVGAELGARGPQPQPPVGDHGKTAREDRVDGGGVTRVVVLRLDPLRGEAPLK